MSSSSPHKKPHLSQQYLLEDFLTDFAQKALSLSKSLRAPPSPAQSPSTLPLLKSAFIKSDTFEIQEVKESDRIFEGWGSIEMVDRDGDFIPIDAISQVMDTYMKRGGVITDSHSSRIVGKMLDWKVRERNDGKKGIWLKGSIHDDYPIDDAVWYAIKSGHYEGFSLGGDAFEKYMECDEAECYQKIPKMALYEWSVVRIPANQGATIQAVNAMAKSVSLQKKMTWDECIAKMKEQYGADEDKVYGTCMKLKNEGKVEGHKKEFSDKAQLFIDYARKKGLSRLLAADVITKCTICTAYVNDLLSAGLTKESAFMLLQHELDTILHLQKKKTTNKEDTQTMTDIIDGEEMIDKQNPPPTMAQPPMQGQNAGAIEGMLQQIIKMLQQMSGQAPTAAPQPPLPKTLKAENPKSIKEPEEDDTDPEKGEDKKEILDKATPLEVVIPPELLQEKISEVLQKDFGIKKVYTPKPSIAVVHPADITAESAKDTTTQDLYKEATTGKIFEEKIVPGDNLTNAFAKINMARFKQEGRM